MRRVLLVDSDPVLRRAIRGDLERHGYAATEAATVPDAFEALSASSFDLLLTELLLPGGDALGILRALAADPAGPRALVMSDQHDDPGLLEAIQLGAVMLLRKPFLPAELIQAIGLALDEPPRPQPARSLLDELLSLHRAEATVRLEGDHWHLSLSAGDLVDAACAGDTGERALARLLASTVPGPYRKAEVVRTTDKTIHRPVRAVLLDALRAAERASPPTQRKPRGGGP